MGDLLNKLEQQQFHCQTDGKLIEAAVDEIKKLRKEVSDGFDYIACWLIDHAEGETITEENMQFWVSKAIKSFNGHKQP